MSDTNSTRQTTIRIPTGTDVTVENHNGPQSIRILVVRSDTGEAGHQQVDEGVTVREVVGDTGQDVRVNGEPAEADQPLHQGDKVTVTPSNPEGN